MTPTQLALAWCYTRSEDAVPCTVVGVTSVDQLRKDVLALNCPVTPQMYKELVETLVAHREPTRAPAWI